MLSSIIHTAELYGDIIQMEGNCLAHDSLYGGKYDDVDNSVAYFIPLYVGYSQLCPVVSNNE